MIALSTITPLGSKYNILFSVSTLSDSNKDQRLEKIPTIISIKKRNVIELTTPFLNFTSILSKNVIMFLNFIFKLFIIFNLFFYL